MTDFIPTSTLDRNEPTPDEVSETWTPPSRPRWVAPVIVLGVLAAVAVAVWQLFFTVAVRPNRVVIVVQTESDGGEVGRWWDEQGGAAERYATGLVKLLGDKGLDVVSATDPKVRERFAGRTTPEEVRAAARGLGAAFTLEGSVRIARVTPLVGSDLSRCEVHVQLRAVPTETENGAPTEAFSEPLVIYETCGPNRGAFLRTLAGELPKLTLTGIAAAFAEQRGITALRDDPSALGAAAVGYGDRVQRLYGLAALRTKLLNERQQTESQWLQTDQRQEKAGPKHPVGAYCAEEYFIGAGPGDTLVVMEEPKFVDVLGGRDKYSLRRGDERFYLTDSAGQNRKLLLQAYNFFSYPSVTRDGAHVAAVLDHGGWSKSLVLVSTADGSVTEVLNHGSEYFSSPVPSPDGQWVAFLDRPCRTCESTLQVIRRDGSGRRTLVEADSGRFSMPVWSPDSRHLYLTATLGEERSALWQMFPDTGRRRQLLGQPPAPEPAEPAADGDSGEDEDDTGGLVAEAEGAEELEGREELAADTPWRSFRAVDVAPDGSFLIVQEQAHDGSHLGRFDVASGSYGRIGSGPIARFLIGPNGQRVALAARRLNQDGSHVEWDDEIAIVPADGGEAKWLTDNGTDDNLMGWSRDGKRVYFHESSRDPGDTKWVTNRVFWVEAP